MCRPVIWWRLQALPMQQCGWHCGSLHCIVSFLFSRNVFFFLHWQCFCIWAHSILLLLSSLLLFFSVILFLWLYLTALNCCSPAGFFLYIYFGVQLWEWCQLLTPLWINHPDDTSPFFAVLTWKHWGGIFFLSKVYNSNRQFMESQTGVGGWRVGGVNFFFKGQSLSGEKNKQNLIEIYLLPLEIKTLLCFPFLFLFQI